MYRGRQTRCWFLLYPREVETLANLCIHTLSQEHSLLAYTKCRSRRRLLLIIRPFDPLDPSECASKGDFVGTRVCCSDPLMCNILSVSVCILFKCVAIVLESFLKYSSYKLEDSNTCILNYYHTGKCIFRFAGIYAYCRFFIERVWLVFSFLSVLILYRKKSHMPKGL